MGDRNVGHKAVQNALKDRFLSKLNTNYMANPNTEYEMESDSCDSGYGD